MAVAATETSDLDSNAQDLVNLIKKSSIENYEDLLSQVITYLAEASDSSSGPSYQKLLLFGLCLQERLPLRRELMKCSRMLDKNSSSFNILLQFRIHVLFVRFCWEKQFLKPLFQLLQVLQKILPNVISATRKSSSSGKRRKVMILGSSMKPQSKPKVRFDENDLTLSLSLLESVSLLFSPALSLSFSSKKLKDKESIIKAIAYMQMFDLTNALLLLKKVEEDTLLVKLAKKKLNLLLQKSTSNISLDDIEKNELNPIEQLLLSEITELIQVKRNNSSSDESENEAASILKSWFEKQPKWDLNNFLSEYPTDSMTSWNNTFSTYVDLLKQSQLSNISSHERADILLKASNIFCFDPFVGSWLLSWFLEEDNKDQIENISLRIVSYMNKLRLQGVLPTSSDVEDMVSLATELCAQSMLLNKQFSRALEVINMSLKKSPLLSLLLGESYLGLERISSASKTFLSVVEENTNELTLREHAFNRLVMIKIDNLQLFEAKTIVDCYPDLSLRHSTKILLEMELAEEEVRNGNHHLKRPKSRALKPNVKEGEHWYDLLCSLFMKAKFGLVVELSPVLLSLQGEDSNSLLLVANAIINLRPQDEASLRVAQHLLLKCCSLEEVPNFDALDLLTRVFLQNDKLSLARPSFEFAQQNIDGRWSANWLLTGLVSLNSNQQLAAFRCSVETAFQGLTPRSLESSLRFLSVFLSSLSSDDETDPSLWRLCFTVCNRLLNSPLLNSADNTLIEAIQGVRIFSGEQLGVFQRDNEAIEMKEDMSFFEAIHLCPWDAKVWFLAARQVPSKYEKLIEMNAIALKKTMNTLTGEEDILLQSKISIPTTIIQLYMLCPWNKRLRKNILEYFFTK